MINLSGFILKKLSYLISPPFCEYCKVFIKDRTILCQNCLNKINPIVSSSVKINQQYVLKVLAISKYDDPLKSLILSKINKNILSSVHLGELIWQMTNLRNLEIDYFVPVPLHWTRQLKRGYNQAEVIASVLSRKAQRPVADIVKRSRYTKFQSSLMHHMKVNNVKNAFKLNIDDFEKYEDRNLVIVDDLFTSGSTIMEISKELIKLKPRSITAVVACKVI